MYLFTRTARMRPGRVRDATPWALGITEKVRQATDLGVSLWTTMFSGEVGTLVWSCFVEDLTTLEKADSKLAADDVLLGEIERGAELVTDAGSQDQVAQVIHGELDPAGPPLYAAVTQSGIVAGGLQRGIEAGIEIARRATQLGGLRTAFLLATTGPYGGCMWLSGAESMQQLEQAEQAVNGDPGFLAFIDDVAPGCYRPEVSVQAIYHRIG